jgi:hypothetical protein
VRVKTSIVLRREQADVLEAHNLGKCSQKFSAVHPQNREMVRKEEENLLETRDCDGDRNAAVSQFQQVRAMR